MSQSIILKHSKLILKCSGAGQIKPGRRWQLLKQMAVVINIHRSDLRHWIHCETRWSIPVWWEALGCVLNYCSTVSCNWPSELNFHIFNAFFRGPKTWKSHSDRSGLYASKILQYVHRDMGGMWSCSIVKEDYAVAEEIWTLAFDRMTQLLQCLTVSLRIDRVTMFHEVNQ